VIVGLALPSGAFAGQLAGDLLETPQTWDSCHSPNIVNPFLFDGDSLDYVLAPSGSFEGGADGWQLEGGASVQASDDGFGLQGGDTDEQVLNLPVGGAATSPVMCVDLNMPTFRFAARRFDSQGKKLRIELVYPDADGKWRKVEDLKFDPTDGWTLTDDLDLEPERGGKLPGGRRVALRFSVDEGANASDTSGYEIDDVYVDPRARR
jgi:hypothetical protein